MKHSLRHIRDSARRSSARLWQRIRSVNPRRWVSARRARGARFIGGATRRAAWLSTVVASRVAPLAVPRLSLTLAANVLYDSSEGTVLRWWTDEAYPKQPERQLQVFKRALIYEGTPLYGRKPQATVVRLITSPINGMRPTIGTNNLVGIDNPTIVLYTGVSVPVTAIWRVARRIRGY